ncbi:testis-expressed sequence 2 protein-like isoform X1 [Lates japonicus]|uniref:Testis-expressed sequence 2 protein-like isoform X1 n=1 Tax=Lates japonicus TaxID=270547 RepID=A0AAD3N538_LATJO|nr:testis-expressed sequence 2 protein-like isoform X1 [Lates japonicus]
MSSQGSSGRGSGQHADTPPPRHAPGPKLQVQRSLSRDTITIHFSALGKEEDDEEEELYGVPGGAKSGLEGAEASGADDQSVATGLEAKEELLFESTGVEGFSGAAVLPVSSTTLSVQPSEPHPHIPSAAMTIIPTSTQSHLSSSPPASSSWPSDRPTANPPSTTSSSSSPCKSAALSSSKPFLSLVRSLSNDVESRESTPAPTTVAPTHARHRHLMKSFVKSLSTDTSKGEHQEGPLHHYFHQQQQQQIQPSHRPPPRNMQLFKQFSQPRLSSSPVIVTQAGGDSKTAPSSPIMSPDGRSFFKVQEVEAKIEDTKRRLSEVMSDPLQLFSKIMGDESGLGAGGSAAHRAKSLSSSASELCGVTAVNGHTEGNNNYSIKEEEGAEGEEEEETPTGKGPDSVFFSFPSLAPAPAPAQASSSTLHKSPSLTLGRCSMSALVARQEDEDFCELYSEDFELCTDTETPDGDRPGSRQPHTGSTGLCSELDTEEEDKADEELEAVPVTGLVFLTQLVYWYLVLPVPPSICAVVHGIAAGFMLALLVLWLSSPRRSSSGTRRGKGKIGHWNVAQLDIKEPGIFKGWMNEIHSYDPEMYHATLTHSVYVRLEGSVLRLSKPNRNISRRATHNEPKPDVTYISQKIYDLTDSKIYLMPQSLARKRVWNKKYPICIELAKQEDFMSKAQGETRPEAGEDKSTGPGEKIEQTDKGEKAEGSASAEEPKRPASGGGDLTIYLFGRTGREKEEWFRRFLLASRMKSEGRGGNLPGICKSAFLPSHSRSSSTQSGGGLEADSRSSSRGSLEELSQSRHREASSSSAPSCGSAAGMKQKMLLDYNVYMAKYVNPQAPPRSPTAADSPGQSPESSPKTTKKLRRSSDETVEPEAWVNAFLGRIFWDFLGEKYWANVVSKKIQMKLSKIRLPYVMNELTLTELDMGFSIPKILNASKPSVDHQGLWFDLEVSYTGSFLMTLETKMNLARLGKEGEGLGEHGKEWPRPRTYCLADSDEESSSAGSSDEEDPPELLSDKPVLPGGEGYVGGHRPSKIMRFVDKIAKSKYFQKATETEFIKKKMEEVSNTPLLLTVEVQECRGTLAVNIPPPPTDRIWYGFRSPPHLELKARPKLGEREVTLVHVTDWIEKKLDQEFQKIFVMPNMDDVWLPIMHSAMDTRSNANLVTVTNDALKDPEPEESEVSSDM